MTAEHRVDYCVTGADKAKLHPSALISARRPGLSSESYLDERLDARALDGSRTPLALRGAFSGELCGTLAARYATRHMNC